MRRLLTASAIITAMPAHLCVVYSSLGTTTAEPRTTAQTLRLQSPKYLLCLKSKFADARSIFMRDGDNAPESGGGNCILISSVTSTESPVAECSMSPAEGLRPSGLPVQLSEDTALLSKNSLCTWMSFSVTRNTLLARVSFLTSSDHGRRRWRAGPLLEAQDKMEGRRFWLCYFISQLWEYAK